MQWTESPIVVSKPGWFTTVQDLGRYGYQQYGVPVAGVMDWFSTIAANRLVGNPDQAAVLELTLKGPELEFQQDAVIAITGGDLSPTIDGVAAPRWQSIKIARKRKLRFSTPRQGSRSYLAVAGGIDVPVVLGSRSTHSSSGTGGMDGRPLKQGDLLYNGQPGRSTERMIGTRLPDRLLPRYRRPTVLRIIQGPQEDFFTDAALATLTSSTYTLAPQSDRMGYRLTGPQIVRNGSARFISDCTAMGTLQIPPDGQPILLMADRQTTGGYPKIAAVITGDLPLAAQLAPGDRVTFTPCSLEQAQMALRQLRNMLDDALPPVESVSVTG